VSQRNEFWTDIFESFVIQCLEIAPCRGSASIKGYISKFHKGSGAQGNALRLHQMLWWDFEVAGEQSGCQELTWRSPEMPELRPVESSENLSGGIRGLRVFALGA